MAFAAFIGQAQPAWAVETLLPACTDNDPNVYVCSGTVNSIDLELDPTGTFRANFGPDDTVPFVWTGSGSGSPAVTIHAGGHDTNIYGIRFNAKSSIDNTDGAGLWLTEAGDDVININGASEGDPEASIIGSGDGIYVEGENGGGSIVLNNHGHIGSIGGAAVEITGIGTVTINNDTYHSMVGATNGDWVHVTDRVVYNNEGGLTAGLDGNGVDIDAIVNTKPGDAVTVDNREGGVFAGTTNGVYVYGTSSTGSGTANVYIRNNATYDTVTESWVAGGLLYGGGGDGAHVDHIGGDATIDNRFTRQGSIDLTGLDTLVYNESGHSGLLYGQLPNGDDFTTGIVGGQNGIAAWGVSGKTTIFNQNGQIVGKGTDVVNAGIDLYQDGSVEIDNGATTYGPGNLPVAGGTIWGNESGIFGNGVTSTEGDFAVQIYNGGRTAEGDGGIVFGVHNGIYLTNLAGDALVSNEGGVVEGYYDRGIVLAAAEESEGSGLVYNVGADSGLGYHEGHVVAGGVAVDIDMAFAGLWNSSGGVVVGEGDDNHPVIRFDTASGEGLFVGESEYGVGIGGVVLNGGIMTSARNPNFDQTTGTPAVNAFPTGGGSADTYGGVPDYYIDTAQIVTDTANIATYAMGNQKTGSIVNLASYWETASDLLFQANDNDGGATALINGEKFSLLSGSGVAAEAEALAPQGTIPTEDGEVTNAIMFGRVQMTGSSELVTGEAEGDTVGVDPAVFNFGAWFTTNRDSESDSDFGNIVRNEFGGTIANAGFIQTAFDSENGDNTSFVVGSGSEGGFYNGVGDEFFTLDNAAAGDGPGLDGWVSLVDGGVGDRTTIDGDFYGSYNTALYHSYLAVDADFGNAGTESDIATDHTDHLIVNGENYGSTGVVVHKLNATTNIGSTDPTFYRDNLNYEVAFTEDSYQPCASQWCADGDAFYIDPHSNGYVNVGGTGFVHDGFYMWGIQQFGDPEYNFVPVWGTDAVVQNNLTSGIAGAGLDTADVPGDNADGNVNFNGGNSGADLPSVEAPVTPGVLAPGKQSIVWGRIVGDWSDRTSSVSTSSLTFDTSDTQDTYALQGGVEFRPSPDSDTLRLGLYGGYLSTNIGFNSYGASAKGTGGTIGGYAGLYKGPWYVDGELKADFLGVTYTSPSVTASTNATNLVAIVNGGYHWQTGASFINPLATLEFVNTSIGNLSSGGATVQYGNGDEFKAGVGVRIGTTLGKPGGTQTQLDLLGRVWDAFGGPNTITLTDSNPLDTVSFSDNYAGISGEVVGRATIYSADRLKSGFVSLGAEFGNSTSVTGKVGAKMGF